ncbi:MAG: aspartyl protease family protein [Thermoguttaceae bacterium]
MSVGAEPSYRAASKPAVRESFKFDPNDPLLLIPVRVGSKDYQFVLDTGATVSMFDVSLRSHLGPRVDSTPVTSASGERVELNLYSPPDARVGSLPLTKDPVLCLELTPFRESSGCSVCGLVGMDFLKNWIIAIDFDEGRLDVLSADTERDPKWGEGIPFVYDEKGLMFVLATVGGNIRTPFAVDTGDAGTGDLEGGLLTRLVGAREARVTGDGKAMDLSGIQSLKVARLSHLSLGSFRHDNLRFISGKRNALGLNYLSRYRLTINFPDKRLHLAKGKDFAYRDTGHTCGLNYLFKGGGLEVISVDEKSPAHAAGFRPKDVIVKLGGKRVSEWKPSRIRRLLGAEGKAVQVTVQRGGKRLEMNFTPKEYD